MSSSGFVAVRQPSALGKELLAPAGETRSSAEGALSGLAGSSLIDRFRFWRGRSGRRYVFSVYSTTTAEAPRYDHAIVIAATRYANGTRRIRSIGQTGTLPDLLFDGHIFQEALADGASEIHVHLLASTPSEREAIIMDLRPTP